MFDSISLLPLLINGDIISFWLPFPFFVYILLLGCDNEHINTWFVEIRTRSWRMFVITRNINGTTETLKSSNSQMEKTFSDKDIALMFVKQLNQSIIPSMHWSVSKQLINSWASRISCLLFCTNYLYLYRHLFTSYVYI